MKTVKNAPGARRLIHSLRDLGYECSTAIADLIDNSIAAKASEVHIEIRAQHGASPAFVSISDNGHGMDREQLQEAMRFGAYQDYSTEDLGAYGLGLKTASLSQCRVLTVSSKARSINGHRPRRCLSRWDLDHIDVMDDWELLLPSFGDLDGWEQEALACPAINGPGTTVLWAGLEERLPLLASHDVRERERYLAKLIKETSGHIRMVFHRFMQGLVPGRRRLRIHLNGEELKAWDPFCRDEATEELEILPLHLTTTDRSGEEVSEKVNICPFILPREDEFSTPKAWKEAAGPRSWNQQQGFYFYRNDRLLQAGGWSWLRAVDEHTKLLRIAVLFPRDLDRLFAVNITKMRARIPAEVKEQVGAAVSKWSRSARERYDRKPVKSRLPSSVPLSRSSSSPKRSEAPSSVNVGPLSFSLSNAPSRSLSVVTEVAGQVRVLVPQGHEVAAIFSTDNVGAKRLCLAMMSLLEALHEGRMKPDAIPMPALKRAVIKIK